MCVIMAKPKGVPIPSRETFRICFNNNPDGCGYMYVEDGQVIIRKGFMGYKNMYKEIVKLGKDKAIVVHFRIGTSGNLKDQKTCHPYPISDNIKDLQKTFMKTDVGMVHNGIIPGYKDIYNKELNDTQVFTRDVLAVLKRLNNKFYSYDYVQEMLENMTGSKLAFLDADEEIYYVGHFINEDGVFYSNNNFRYTWRSEDYGYGNNIYYNYDNYYNRNKSITSSSNLPATIGLGKNDNGEIKSSQAVIDYDKTLDDEFYDKVYDEEINYDNYIEVEVGQYISTSTDWFVVTEEGKFGIDDRGNYFELQPTGFPGRILRKNATLYDENYEEVIF